MSTLLSLIELRRLGAEELAREIEEKRVGVAQLRLGIQMRKEKDTAKYRREKRQLAKMLTVQREKAPVLHSRS